MYNNDTVINLHNNATMKQYNDNKKDLVHQAIINFLIISTLININFKVDFSMGLKYRYLD